MEIIKKNTGELEATLIVKIEAKDYAEPFEQELKKMRKTASLKGFRPGKVPIALVKKMYGNEIKAQEAHKFLNKSVDKYLKENNINIVGELLASKTEETKFDVENSDDFQFSFDIAYYPEIDIKVEELTVPKYRILVEDELLDNEIDNLLDKYGDFIEIETVIEKSQIRTTLTELNDDNTPKEEGISIKDGLVLIDFLDADTQKMLIGAKKEDKFTIEIKKSFKNETDLAALLKIKKEELEQINTNFELIIEKIEEYKKGELNQDFYDKLYGKDIVKSEEEMTEKIKEAVEQRYSLDSNEKFNYDLKKLISEKIEMNLPVEFIIRWQMERRKEETEENIRKEIKNIKEAMKWSRILTVLSDKYNITINERDILDAAKGKIIEQIAQMGLSTDMFNEEQLDQFAHQEIDKMNENDRYYLEFSVLERKVLEGIADKTIKEEKDITFDELKEMYEKENKKIEEQTKIEDTTTTEEDKTENEQVESEK